MKVAHITGLGEPEVTGKRSLFQPSKELVDKQASGGELASTTKQRIRTTIELSAQAVEIIQQFQTQHRLKTGKVLPLWKLVGEALENYSRIHQNENQ
jgi:hypothetical protein